MTKGRVTEKALADTLEHLVKAYRSLKQPAILPPFAAYLANQLENLIEDTIQCANCYTGAKLNHVKRLNSVI